MLKTVKGKVIAGTVAVTLLVGTGAAFGSSLDAGQKLKAWYDGQFGNASGQIEDAVASNVEGRINGLVTEYNGLKTGATTSINDTKTAESTAKSTSISNEAQAHIDKINAEKAHIDTYLAGQFNSLRGFANGLINQAGTTAVNYANTDLTNHTGAKGTAALGALESDLNATTTQAKEDLQTAIDNAKNSLQGQLDTETTETTEEIIALIDAKIIELRTTITAKRDALVVAQQDLIKAKALALETEAKKSLSDIVDGI